MKRITWVAFAMVALLLGALIYFLKHPRHHPEENRGPGSGERLLTFNEGDCVAWEVHWGGQTCSVERDDKGDWWILGPRREKADAIGVLANIKNFNTLDVEREIGAYPSEAVKYGLERPSNYYRWVLRGDHGPLTNTLYEGAWRDAPRGVFMALDGGAKIYFAQDWVVLALQKRNGDVRPKKLLPYDPDEVTALTLGSNTFVKEKLIWKIEGHPEIKVVSAKVDDLVQTISMMRAEYVYDPGEAPNRGASQGILVVLKGKGRGNRQVPPEVRFSFYRHNAVSWVSLDSARAVEARVKAELSELLDRPLAAYIP